MYYSGQPVIAYLGEDRQIYLNRPGKTVCEFPARIIQHGDKKIIFITDVPDKYDGGAANPPSGFELQGLDQT
jgi:hypothetical protein